MNLRFGPPGWDRGKKVDFFFFFFFGGGEWDGCVHRLNAILIHYIEMVWAHNKINRTCKDNPTGHGTRREKERQTEKEVGR